MGDGKAGERGQAHLVPTAQGQLCGVRDPYGDWDTGRAGTGARQIHSGQGRGGRGREEAKW